MAHLRAAKSLGEDVVREPGQAHPGGLGRGFDPVHQLLSVQRSAGNAAATRAVQAGLIARAPVAAPAATPGAPAGPRTHAVSSGESLQAIAKRFGVTVQALSEANADKIKKWSTPQGDRFGFNAGEVIVIPRPAPTPDTAGSEAPAATPAPTTGGESGGILDTVGDALEWASDVWDSFFGKTGTPVPAPAPGPAPPETAPPPTTPVPAPSQAPAATTPIDVIAARNADGTFSQAVTVTSTKRDGSKQLTILRNYCKANKAAVDDYAEKTDWLKDSLDWTAFEAAELGDEAIWLPFFFALFYGGGGPGVKSSDRTLPLVASPTQTTWTDKKGGTKTANASPHIAGKAMDVDAPDLSVLDSEIKTKVPEFSAGGAFPIKSTQVEDVSGQGVVHINFKKPVF